MNNKILFLYSEQKIELPKQVLAEYQVTAVPLRRTNIKDVILQFKPQIIIFDEYVEIKYVKSVCAQFKFIPVCVIGEFGDRNKLEKFLNLGVSVINTTLPEIEIISTIHNLLWFSLSKEDLWDEEYKLNRSEFIKSKIFVLTKFIVSIVMAGILLFFISRSYKMLALTQPLFQEIDIRYITPSDITVFNDKYLINDWTVKNLFEYDETSGELVKMYIPEKQFHSISINEKKYGVVSSMFTGMVYMFKYPEFSETHSTLNVVQGKTIMSVSIDDDNHIYILDNKGTLYVYHLNEDNKLVFLSSVIITEFLPIDVCSVDKFLLFLDNRNNLYLTKKDEPQKVVSTIVMEKFFDSRNTNFSSVDVSKKWIYLVSEKSKKIFKLNKNLLLL